jgi:hypothetical protein
MRIPVVMKTRARQTPETPSSTGPTFSSGGKGFGGTTAAIDIDEWAKRDEILRKRTEEIGEGDHHRF